MFNSLKLNIDSLDLFASITKQYNLVGTGQGAAMLFSWDANCRLGGKQCQPNDGLITKSPAG